MVLFGNAGHTLAPLLPYGGQQRTCLVPVIAVRGCMSDPCALAGPTATSAVGCCFWGGGRCCCTASADDEDADEESCWTVDGQVQMR